MGVYTEFAFGFCNLDELQCINSAVTSDEFPNNNNNNNNNNITNNKNILSNLSGKGIDDNIPNLTSCKYYTVSEFYNSPTRIQGDSATIVDNIFTNTWNSEIHSGNIITELSDHFSQFVSVGREKLDFKKITMYRRNYSSFSEDSFRDDVSIQNVNDQFIDFYWRLKGCVDRHAPLKRLTPKEAKLKNKPWISDEINKMIKIKIKLFHRKKRQPNSSKIKKLYNLFRNRVNKELKKAKRSYYTKYFTDNSNNVKKTWEGIRSIINIKSSKEYTISQIKVNNKKICNHKEIAETLNQFFVNVGPNTEKNIPVNPKIKPEKFLNNRNQLNFLIAHIYMSYIIRYI